MAITKIHPIKSTLKLAINYIIQNENLNNKQNNRLQQLPEDNPNHFLSNF